jgi:hypothetical protein
MKRLILAAALTATPALAQTTPQPGTPNPGDVAVHLAPDGRTQFTLVTPAGYVGFASGDWAVINIHSDLPAAGFDFQIPDPADQGTSESTNISLDVYQPATREARNAEAQFGRSLEPAGRPKMETYNGWTICSQGVVAKGTPYSLIDAESRQGDVEVFVHLNWPHLSGQPGTHNADMRALMLKTLDSVSSGTGAYAVQPGETVRRFTGKAG